MQKFREKTRVRPKINIYVLQCNVLPFIFGTHIYITESQLLFMTRLLNKTSLFTATVLYSLIFIFFKIQTAPLTQLHYPDTCSTIPSAPPFTTVVNGATSYSSTTTTNF